MWRVSISAIALISNAPLIAAGVDHLCWVDRVEAEGKEGLRIFYTPDFPWKSSEFDKGKYLKVGEQTFVSLATHDMCTLKAVREGDKLGVEAHFSFTALKPQPPKLDIAPITNMPFPYIAPPPPPENSEYFTRDDNEWIEATKPERARQSK